MRLLKSFAIAFCTWSKIPFPQFAWNEEDMEYMLCFFPWVGAGIGAFVYVWRWFCGVFLVGPFCHALIGAAIPLLVTGGFHADGFMDAMDAFHSYQPKEKKLEILKDAHIGAFSVLMLALYGLVYVGAFSEVTNLALLKIVCGGFFLSRCLSGISVVSFPLAKKDGMLRTFSDSAKKPAVKGLLYVQALSCICFMVLQSMSAGMLADFMQRSRSFWGR